MQALSDDEQVGGLEKKVDDGFAEMRGEFKAVRAEARSDFRTLIAVTLTMLVTMIFGFAGLVVALLTHHV
jgi:hypothetical protein